MARRPWRQFLLPGSAWPNWSGASARWERANADLREQKAILKKAVVAVSEVPSPARRHGVISDLAGEFPIKALCRTLGVSRSGYYAAQKKAARPRARDNARLGGKIREAFEASRRTCGSPQFTVTLRRAGGDVPSAPGLRG